MSTAAIVARIEAACPVLTGRMGTALQYAEAIRRGQAPQVTPAGFVLPVGLRGGQADAATGLFRQSIDRVLGVVLVIRSAADPLGTKVGDQLDEMVADVIAAIVGWGPDSAIGVYRLSRGNLLGLEGGVATYQLDFILDDQLRIST